MSKYIVAKLDPASGQPRPSQEPVVHANYGLAEEEARRLAAKYSGQKYTLLQVTGCVFEVNDVPTSSLNRGAQPGWYRFTRTGSRFTPGTRAQYAAVSPPKADGEQVVVFFGSDGQPVPKPTAVDLRWERVDGPCFN